ncbi:MAG: hypothetical protein PHD73_00715 [Sediminibacterium sp.]|nr:hypothetical protein [Sediminibacterium sp.]
MKSKYLMVASSSVAGFLGIATSFFPKEIVYGIGLIPKELPVLFVQITGALYFGFAILNWMAKDILIGGIYARPLCIGNFLHFLMGALALVKSAVKNPGSEYIWIAAFLYSLFALLFGRTLFFGSSKKSVTGMNKCE